MESAKSALAVALADERHGAGWRRPRTRARIAAVLASLLAATVVFGLFNRFGLTPGEHPPERLLIGSVDMGIAHRALGRSQARTDIEAGLFQLLGFGPATAAPDDAAKAERLKHRYGVARVNHGESPTPQSQAYADGYNAAVKAELQRRHGQDFVDRLLRDLDLDGSKPAQAVTP